MPLKCIPTRIATMDTRSAKPPPKTADPYYRTPEHQAWRAKVIARAGGRCQWVSPSGARCTKAHPHHRMYADHITERSDGGHDQGKGQCLCGAHHTLKTVEQRAKRYQ